MVAAAQRRDDRQAVVTTATMWLPRRPEGGDKAPARSAGRLSMKWSGGRPRC